LEELLERLRASDRSLYLDTNGSMPDPLDKVVDYVDTVCLDFKIPSATGLGDFWQQNERSLIIAAGREVFVKVVVDGNMVIEELDTVCTIIARVNKSIPLVIQPVFGKDVPDLLSLQRRAMDVLDDVRVIPQVHKYLNVR
jgi:organic radical activating enzyme